MAKGTEVETVDGASAIGYADSPDFEWETAHVEAGDQVVFDAIGDLLIAVYAGHEIIYPDMEKTPLEFFVQLHWTVPGGSVFANAGHDLTVAYVELAYNADGSLASHIDKVAPGSMTRNEMRKTVDTGKNDPMKSFRVDVAKVKPRADNSAG